MTAADQAGPTGPADQRGHELAETLASMSRNVTAIKADIDRLMPPLVDTLKRNRYFDELQQHLRQTEKIAQAWRDWPLIIGIHDAVLDLRRTDASDPHLLEHLEGLIFHAGVTEYGFDGDEIDPLEAEITASTGSGRRIVVSSSRRLGLRIGPVPLRKPIVEVTRQERSTDVDHRN